MASSTSISAGVFFSGKGKVGGKSMLNVRFGTRWTLCKVS